MIRIKRKRKAPYCNIAAEEYLFKNSSEDICMVWCSDPCVVVGKHQNAFSEVNQDFINDNNIPLIRRITGGGTVYHDEGNLNYSLILNKDNNAKVNYEENTRGIISALRKLKLNAKLQDKSNITVDGVKVSGNSEHIFKNKILHHGTLLFSSDLYALERIKGKELSNYSDKAVKSIRKKVINISDLIDNTMDFEEFSNYISNFLFDYYNCENTLELNKKDHDEIERLVQEKYRKWEWNYGYSPSFKLSNSFLYQGKEHQITVYVSSGLIRKIEYKGDNITLQSMVNKMTEVPYRKQKIEERINSLNFAKQLPESLVKIIIQELF